MSNDDSRGLESPDRFDASTTATRVRTDGGTPERSIRERLETIDRLTKTLLEDVQTGPASAELEGIDRETCREATRHVREIRAEASRVGLLLIGPEASIPYRPRDDPERDVPLANRRGPPVTTYSGPEPEALASEEHRTCEGTETEGNGDDARNDPADEGGDRDD